MIQIRQGVFETNSSSTHSLCIMTESDYKKWCDGTNEYYLVYSDYSDEFNKCFPDGIGQGVYSKDVVQDAINKYAKAQEEKHKDDKWYRPFDTHVLEHSDDDDDDVEDERRDTRMYDLCIYTTEDWNEYNDEVEEYEEFFTTPSGDKMVAFGAYGYR